MGGEQAASVLSTIQRDKREAAGKTWSTAEEEAFKVRVWPAFGGFRRSMRPGIDVLPYRAVCGVRARPCGAHTNPHSQTLFRPRFAHSTRRKDPPTTRQPGCGTTASSSLPTAALSWASLFPLRLTRPSLVRVSVCSACKTAKGRQRRRRKRLKRGFTDLDERLTANTATPSSSLTSTRPVPPLPRPRVPPRIGRHQQTQRRGP